MNELFGYQTENVGISIPLILIMVGMLNLEKMYLLIQIVI